MDDAEELDVPEFGAGQAQRALSFAVVLPLGWPVIGALLAGAVPQLSDQSDAVDEFLADAD